MAICYHKLFQSTIEKLVSLVLLGAFNRWGFRHSNIIFEALLIKYSIQVSVAFEHQKHNGILKHVLAFAVAL